ncbi:DUF2396 family protein [Oscillatoriales cyanobacterium LEGE 11467]|uniref:DUF2396 family protein n=1 Tax=Zarconia navalis LEGE 11467 TaxID=1828826 RepID=A0A928VUY3_9CYAN|nr:DUF2396 family protein [Zarconia navalis]MBE9039182.1 DUF2396 family protein [Zarconia navalis LEGE 11467]
MTQSASPSPSVTPLNFRGAYRCPACRRGQISALVLTEAFGCNTCNHIFTANLAKQSVQVVDSSPPLAWRWNGRKWKPTHRDVDPLNGWVWCLAIAFVLLPTSIVALGAYVFPPLPDSAWGWFPLAWAGLTLGAHFACVAWLVMEYYQFPAILFLRLGQRRLSSTGNSRLRM